MVTSSVDVNWMLDDLVNRIPQIKRAIVLSRDGLATGSSDELAQDEAERLAAMAAGFHSLARGASGYLVAGAVRQIIVEMADYYLFVTAAGENDCLAVITESKADMGLVGYEMAMLIKRLGAHLSTPRRVPLGGSGAI